MKKHNFYSIDDHNLYFIDFIDLTMSRFNSLPKDVFRLVMSYMNVRELARLQKTSTADRAITKEEIDSRFMAAADAHAARDISRFHPVMMSLGPRTPIYARAFAVPKGARGEKQRVEAQTEWAGFVDFEITCTIPSDSGERRTVEVDMSEIKEYLEGEYGVALNGRNMGVIVGRKRQCMIRYTFMTVDEKDNIRLLGTLKGEDEGPFIQSPPSTVLNCFMLDSGLAFLHSTRTTNE